MRRSTAQFLAVTAALTLGACGFTPKAEMTGSGSTGAANSSGQLTGTGNSTGSGASSGGGGHPGMSTLDVNCGVFMQGAQMVPPDILIVQDKSGSMNDSADGTCTGNCGANSKWSQVTTALNMVVASTDTQVNWGLKFFATGNSGCNVNAAAEVGVGTGHAAMIAAAIAAARPGSSTPTRTAEAAGAAYLGTLTDTNPKFLLLATDGLPNCVPGDNNQQDDDSAGAEAAVTAALTAGFPTFVVGIGNTMGDATLNQMALNGGRPQMMPPAATSFYQVNDTAGLVAALNTIVGSVASCTFNLGTPPNSMTSNNSISVYGDGTLIPKDLTNMNGWDYIGTGNAQIQIFGSTCDMITAGTIKNVSITYQCIVN